jgi:hypothetical protein
MVLSLACAEPSFIRHRKRLACKPARLVINAFLSLLLLLTVLASGCDHTRHTYDPQLRRIDQLLNAHLPAGTPRSQVQYYLKSRGYQLEGHDTAVVRAVVRQVDPDTLRPAAARVTFHFDANDRLTTYDLEAVPGGSS